MLPGAMIAASMAGKGAAASGGLGALGWTGAGLSGAGLLGSFLSGGGRKSPDISGELANIAALFEQLRAQNRININREAAQGRTQAASNLATRGTYRSGVAQNTFNALEGERLNAIANSDAQLAGQEAGMRAGLLRTLLGLDADAQQQRAGANAARFGNITGIGSNLLLAQLLRGS